MGSGGFVVFLFRTAEDDDLRRCVRCERHAVGVVALDICAVALENAGEVLRCAQAVVAVAGCLKVHRDDDARLQLFAEVVGSIRLDRVDAADGDHHRVEPLQLLHLLGRGLRAQVAQMRHAHALGGEDAHRVHAAQTAAHDVVVRLELRDGKRVCLAVAAQRDAFPEVVVAVLVADIDGVRRQPHVGIGRADAGVLKRVDDGAVAAGDQFKAGMAMPDDVHKMHLNHQIFFILLPHPAIVNLRAG